MMGAMIEICVKNNANKQKMRQFQEIQVLENILKFHLLCSKLMTKRMVSIPQAHYFFRKYIPSRSSNFSSETRPDKKLCSCWSDLSYGGSAMQNIYGNRIT